MYYFHKAKMAQWPKVAYIFCMDETSCYEAVLSNSGPSLVGQNSSLLWMLCLQTPTKLKGISSSKKDTNRANGTMYWDRIKQWWKRQAENNLWQNSYRRWSDKMWRNSREAPVSAWDYLCERKLSRYWCWRDNIKSIVWEIEKEAGWTWG